MNSTTLQTFITALLFGRTEKTYQQLFRYLIIGGFAAIIDTGIFMLFTTTFHFHYFLAQTFGFTFGIITNYILSISWVFERKRDIISETSLFLTTGIIGLLLSYFFLWVFIDILHVNFFENLVAKIMTIALVLMWNFTSRKFFVFK